MKSRMLWHYAATGGSYRPFANRMIQFSFADPKTKSNNVKKICWEDDLCVFVLPRLWKQKLRCEFTETMRADNVSPVITGEDNHRDKCLIQYTNIWYLHKAHRVPLPDAQIGSSCCAVHNQAPWPKVLRHWQINAPIHYPQPRQAKTRMTSLTRGFLFSFPLSFKTGGCWCPLED